LLTNGTINGKFGTFIVSALGGAPRFLTVGSATFYANGDSLLLGPGGASEKDFMVQVAGLDGTVRDSIRVPGPGASLASLVSIPGTTRFVALVIQNAHGLWQVLERDGTVRDKLLNSCTCGAAASRDALWMTRAGPTAAEAVVRVALDPSSGKFAAHQDTIYSGRFSNLSVNADGTQMAVDDGSYTFSVAAGPLADLISGKIGDGAPLMQASNRVGAQISPDGARLLMRRSVPTSNGGDDLRYSIAPYGGGAETPLNLSGHVVAAQWDDSVTVAIRALTPTGSHLSRVDVRTGAAASGGIDVPDSVLTSFVALPNGWAWIPTKPDRVVVMQGGARREIAKPSWFDSFMQVAGTPDGSRLAVLGWGTSGDSIRVDVVPSSGGPTTEWSRSFAETGAVTWLGNESLAFTVWSGSDAADVRQVSGPNHVKTLGALGHVAATLSVSRDLQRATIGWRDYRGDAWMYRVVKP
jgi:hypothetical protein